MVSRICFFSVLAFAVLIITGCGPGVRPPEIVDRDDHIRPIPPTPMTVSTTIRPTYSKYPPGWVPARTKERSWKAIVIHHSAKNTGNMAMIDEYHRTHNGWEGVGYDFVIGNGRGSDDGEVEVTFRWRKQMAGAHCGGTANNWANEYGIGICLVGDFTKTRPTYSQIQSLKKLVRFLQKRYGIPTRRVYGHCTTPGYTRGSVCPGKYFPMESFKRSL